MAALLLTSLLLLYHSLLSLAQGGSEPLQVLASSRTYGPDGPWQAVTVQLGTPPQNLDLFPGGVFQSSVFTNQQCGDQNSRPCGSVNLFDPSKSSSFDNTSILYEDNSTKQPSGWTNGAILLSYSKEVSIRETLQIAGHTVADFSVATYKYPDISMVYPDGNYPLQVGALSLGPDPNQTFGSINTTLIPGSLAGENIIPGSSFGLHVGTTATQPLVKLSLWLGGYDASRIVGPVSSQDIQDDAGSELVIDLLDIGIGVDHGGSPFPFSSQQGLLSEGNSSITSNGISVSMNPSAPYMNLPNDTCFAIAKRLPVKYNAGKALYLWDVTDPQFAKIVSSPTYLNFIFRSNSTSSGNLTIHVPFSLLNLTLEEPLVSTPTPYFPCQPPQTPDNSLTYYSLGRAFLQAAFIGVTWFGSNQGVGTWYLAQAPGPSTNTNPQQKPLTIDVPPVGLSANWSDTWMGFWTALPLSPSPTTSAVPLPSRHGLSGGAIAGIAIGGAVAVLIVIGICFRRKRAGKSAAGFNMHMNKYRKQGGTPVEDSATDYEPMYKDQEGNSNGEPVELSVTREHVGELQ